MPTVLNYVKKYWVALIAILVVFLFFRGCSKKQPQGEFSWELDKKARVTKGPVVFDVSATGEIQPQNRLEVRPPIDGRVEKIFVKEGDEVKQGQMLAELSSTERATLLDAARSKGEESLAYWQDAYRPTPLIAPIDGMIIVRAVEPGQTLSSSDAVVVISDRLIVDVQVNETDIGFVKVGQPSTIILDSYPDRSFTGSVDHIAYEAVLEQNVNIYHVDILPNEIDPLFRSGMTAQAMIRVAENKEALLLPHEATYSCPPDVKQAAGNSCVAVRLKNEKPVWKEVKTGISSGGFVEIISGLEEGDTALLLRKQKNENRSEKSGFGPFASGKRRS